MESITQGVLGSLMTIVGLAILHMSVPAAGEASKISDGAAPFVSTLCAGLIFGGGLLLFSAVVL